MRMRRIIRQVHGWTGAFAAVFLLLVAVSGASLAFMSEMLLVQYGDVLRSNEPSAPPVDLDAIVASGTAAAGEGFQPFGILMPHTRVPGVETAMLYGARPGADADYPWMISVDPATAVTKGMFRLDQAFGHDMIDFHTQLLAGETGTTFVSALGFMTMTFSLSGLWLWWPGGRRVRAKLGFPAPVSRRANFWYALHGWVGLWVSGAIFFFAFTGVATAKPDWLGLSEPRQGAPANANFSRVCEGKGSTGDAARTAARLYPDRRLTMVDFPGGPDKPYTLHLHRPGDWNTMEGDLVLLVHPTCAGLIHAIDVTAGGIDQSVNAAAFSLHGGYSFGPVLGDILVITTGVALAFLAGSGVVAFLRMQGWTVRARKRSAVGPSNQAGRAQETSAGALTSAGDVMVCQLELSDSKRRHDRSDRERLPDGAKQ